MRGSFSLALIGLMALVASANAAEVDKCPPLESDTAPRTVITKGQVSAMVLLPDAQNGFYRGTRFDWSGVVWCLTYKEHSYFGEWYAKNQVRNRITGPVEEFRAADGRSSPGYDAAKPGDPFVKPGVGVLRRVDEKPYSFNADYPVVDGGKWTVKPGKDQVFFRHELSSPIMAYRYEKTLRLERNAPVLVLEHALKNTGKEPIDIQVYNHDFFILDGTPPGPDISIRFPFTPVAVRALQNGARIDGKSIVFESTGGASSEITGYSDKASDFDFFVENSRTGAGVEEIGDVPLSRIDFWSNMQTACPEAYVHITVPPGKTGRWSIRYRFYDMKR